MRVADVRAAVVPGQGGRLHLVGGLVEALLPLYVLLKLDLMLLLHARDHQQHVFVLQHHLKQHFAQHTQPQKGALLAHPFHSHLSAVQETGWRLPSLPGLNAQLGRPLLQGLPDCAVGYWRHHGRGAQAGRLPK